MKISNRSNLFVSTLILKNYICTKSYLILISVPREQVNTFTTQSKDSNNFKQLFAMDSEKHALMQEEAHPSHNEYAKSAITQQELTREQFY